MSESLSTRLHTLHVEHLVRSAETIRDWPDKEEMLDQAARLVREAMYLLALKKISQAERAQVFSILNVSLPNEAHPDEREGNLAENAAPW